MTLVVAVLASVAIAFGAGIMLVGGDGESSAPSVTSQQSTQATTDVADTAGSAAGEASETSESTVSPVETSGFGRVELTPPDPELMIETADWGLVPGDYVVVVLEEGEDRERASEIASAFGGAIVGEIEYLGLFQIALEDPGEAGMAAALEVLETTDGVAFAFPDLPIPLRAEYHGVRTSPLNDSTLIDSVERGTEAIGVQRAWDYIAGSGLDLWESKVGVVDDGIRRLDRDSEFNGSVAVTRSDGAPRDSRGGGHGADVVATIGADADNGLVTGIAAVLRENLKISVANGGWDNSWLTPADLPGVISKSIKEMTTQVEVEGAKVINMSWGRTGMGASELHEGVSGTMRSFFEKMAEDHPDVLFVCAAGNDGHDKVPDRANYWPCGHELPNVITVAHTEPSGSSSGGTVHGSPNFEVTVGAPATSSSWAAPMVTATAALMRALDPSLSAGDIKEIIQNTARKKVAAEPGGATTDVDPGVGAGMLAIDEAVLNVINRVRKSNGLDPITGEQLIAFGVIDAVAIGDPDEFVVRATITGCRGECTDISISIAAEHALSGSNPVSLSSPGEVEWELTVHDDYPVSILVRRLDNGAGSRITIEPVEIAGTWTGTLRITEIISPEGAELPDGSTVDPGNYEGDALDECSAEVGQALGEGLATLFEEGIPIEMTFTGTLDEPGLVTVSGPDGTGDPETVPWRLDGGSIVIEVVNEDGYTALSGTLNGDSISGALGAVTSDDGVEMRGEWSVTRVGD